MKPRRRIDAQILHLDREVVVVAKPAGVLSVPYGDHDDRDSLQHWVGRALRRRLKRHLPPVRVVQRLDKDTSGVLVFARTHRAQRELQQQFRRHSVDRRYLALALGIVRDATVKSVLVPNRGDGLRGSWRGRGSAPSHGRDAVTHIERLKTLTAGSLSVSLVSCRLETGRQHQIRIHLAERGHPVVGERVYVRDYRGSYVHGYAPGSGRALLHAERLGFVHPADRELRTFVMAPPGDFATLLDRLETSTIPRD